MIPLLFLIGTIIVIAVSAAVIFSFKIPGTMAYGFRINWRLPLYTAAGTLILFSPVMIYGGDSDVLYIVLMALLSIILIIAALVLAFFKKWGIAGAIVSMLLTSCVLSLGLLKNVDELHDFAQWHLHSNTFRTQLMAQPSPTNGEFKHIEWDGWGFAGMETVAYLVFDPADSLAVAAKAHSSGKFKGIPCGVNRVHRLESHYYTVLFYTDTSWNSCRY